jgi:hypothetical protein
MGAARWRAEVLVRVEKRILGGEVNQPVVEAVQVVA